MTLKNEAELMKPYRARIDAIDREMIELLRKRYDVIREVGAFKTAHGLPAVIEARVDEVRENAARLAAEKGLDEDFIRHLYAQIIKHSCDMEEEMIQQASEKKTAAR